MASAKNLATPPQQDNPEVFEKFWRDFGMTVHTSPAIERDEDEPEEHDDTNWQDFLGYHDEARR